MPVADFSSSSTVQVYSPSGRTTLNSRKRFLTSFHSTYSTTCPHITCLDLSSRIQVRSGPGGEGGGVTLGVRSEVPSCCSVCGLAKRINAPRISHLEAKDFPANCPRWQW